jgi:hypothetical protein
MSGHAGHGCVGSLRSGRVSYSERLCGMIESPRLLDLFCGRGGWSKPFMIGRPSHYCSAECRKVGWRKYQRDYARKARAA